MRQRVHVNGNGSEQDLAAIAASSAVQEVEQHYRMPVVSVASLDDLIGYLADSPALAANLDAVRRYRASYGVAHAEV